MLPVGILLSVPCEHSLYTVLANGIFNGYNILSTG